MLLDIQVAKNEDPLCALLMTLPTFGKEEGWVWEAAFVRTEQREAGSQRGQAAKAGVQVL